MRWLVLTTTVLLASCRTHTASTDLTTRPLVGLSPGSGRVSATLLPDPTSPTVQLGPGEEYVPPHLMTWNPQPAYPAHLVSLHLPPYSVVMRVTFDEEGTAIATDASPLAPSTSGEYRQSFEDAVRVVLQEWRCHPPQIRKFRPGPDNDGDGKMDYRVLDASRRLKSFFDVSFSFEVVNGQPVVRPSQ